MIRMWEAKAMLSLSSELERGREGGGGESPSNAESLLWTGGSRKAKASLSLSTGTAKEGGGREMLRLLSGF